jgi:hypothetical protein
MSSLIFVDCEANGKSPSTGFLTEFGAVSYPKRETFHGILYDRTPDPTDPTKRIVGNAHDAEKVFADFELWLKKVCNGSRPVFISDNPAFDWQWINDGFHVHLGHNPFGHSARRISDFYAGLAKDFNASQKWKKWRVTPHDHNPVHDSLGNVEAFATMLKEFEVEL